jgi:hypothetical protein
LFTSIFKKGVSNSIKRKEKQVIFIEISKKSKPWAFIQAILTTTRQVNGGLALR